MMILAEGHAFRKSLCEGNETTGFEWLGPNHLYNNGNCHSPEEHWMHCGTREGDHECTWFKRARIVIKSSLNTLMEETVGIIEEGLEVVGGWVGGLFAKLWPYLLMILGLLISGVIVLALVKGGVKAAPTPMWEENRRTGKAADTN